MSTLLEKASLVMIPSGYKEDVVYSQIPTNGDGDLTFTRASDGTRVNSAGLVERVPWNLAEYSEDFSNAYWGKTGSSITANTIIAPNGTTTADTFTRTINTGYIYNGSFSLAIGQYTQSVYAKANDSSSIRLEFVTSAFGLGAACIFDLSNGTAGTITIYGGVSGFTATIESVGNGWYRCSLGGTITIADTYFYELSITSGSVYIWGAQLNIGSTAKPYFPTTDRLNVPRLDYSGGSCPSLLLEPQRTNLQTYSEQMDNAAWTKFNVSITANVGISPDGTQNADLTYITSGTSVQNYNSQTRSGLTNGATYTQSVFLKASGFTWAIVDNVSGSAGAWFNLVNGTIGTVVSGSTAKIENYGNGWYRCSVTSNAFSTSGYGDYRLANADNDVTATANGTNGILAWGFQFEQGSYPTSYIPTTSSSATRVADVCSKTGISSLIGQTEGTMFVDFVKENNDVGVVQISDGTTSNRIYLGVNGTNIICQVRSGGGTSQAFFSIASTNNTRYKCAIAYKENDFVLYINGNQEGIDTSGLVPASFTQLQTSDIASSIFVNPINEVLLFPTRLTNAELASLTTI